MPKPKVNECMWLKQHDLFAKPHPGFMFRGRPAYTTWYGTMATLAMFAIILWYMLPKIVYVFSSHNPTSQVIQ